jgi:hypothetical protein
VAKARLIQNSFNAGEISPAMYGRVEFPRYANGVETLENWFLQTQGGVTRRWGTKYVASAKVMSTAVRLIPFEFNSEVFCLIELGDLYIRIHRISPAAGVVDVSTTLTLYSASELFEVQYAQSADVIYLTHANHPVRKLSRLASDSSSWSLRDVTFAPGPSYEKEQYPATTLAPIQISGTGIRFHAYDNYFLAADVDKVIQFGDSKGIITAVIAGEDHVDVDIIDSWPAAYHVAGGTNNLSSAGTAVTVVGHGLTAANAGDAIILTSGPQSGQDRHVVSITDLDTFEISDAFGAPQVNRSWERALHMDAGAWKLVGSPSSQLTSDKISPVGAIATLTLATAGWRNVDAGKSWDVSDVGKYVKAMGGLLKITSWTSTTVVKAEILSPLSSAPAAPYVTLAGTWTLEEPAWSASAGYPAAVNFFEQRLWFAGTTTKVQTLWGSCTGDYENFAAGVNAGDSVEYTIATNDLSPIRWLTSARVLLIGASGREFRASGGAGAISPTNIDIRVETSYGSPKRRPVQIGHTTIFVQRAGRKVRELEYSFESDNYKGNDLTVIAPHISEGGISELSYAPEPYSTMYAIRGDGQILVLTYEKAQEVFGWGRWITDGAFESVAILPPVPGSDEYQIFVVVNRTIGGATKRYIEKFNSAMHADSGVYGTMAPGVTVTGLSHLNGETVTMKGDGALFPDAIVAAGQVTFPSAITTYDVGLPYVSTLVTHKPEIQTQAGGTVQGKPKRWNSLYVRVLDTIGLKINGTQVGTRDPADLLGSACAAESGDLRADVMGIDSDAKITIVQDLPFPATVLAIIGELSVGD